MIIYPSSSDMSDRYNNLKAAWNSLMEAAEHASPKVSASPSWWSWSD
jgi:hypothetical protein